MSQEPHRDIRIHIERLVLDGLPLTRADGVQVQASLEAELTRLLSEGGLPAHLATGGALPGLAAENLQLAPNGSPAHLGRQIARSVHGGLVRAK